ncbi:lysozyme inhibitor LprI family protein [Phenylobacterium sp.]|uniref:lysozyme inhibitor LprI family protein n=1 Tax=Phenylobacterium sp. TaxID=1871053 RepID=UPI002D0695F0|nr:lysozyme inhibitor LprI family protein [Phenylobacterium sp.]HVI31894.1 lysozyme inhibitor LprI family protein [Phenylobacterium sp.]
MPKDPIGEPWAGTTYNGFAGQAAVSPPAASRPPQDRIPRKLVIGGVAGAVALGLVFGLWARPDFGDDGRAREPMKAVTQAEAVSPPVPVEVAAPVPPPTPRADGPLEVLPPELARAAPAPAAGPAPMVRAEAPRPPVVVAPSASESSAPVVARAPEPAPFVPPRRRADANPSFNCRYARSTSEEMVCADPQLAAADRRLNRAYERAIASGIPARELRAEQDDWLGIREDAARRSPRAVASVYEQRIRELNALAEDGEY